MTERGFTSLRTAQDVTDEIREMAESIVDGWFATGPMDWPRFFDKMENLVLENDTHADFGEDPQSGAVLEVQRHVRRYRSLK